MSAQPALLIPNERLEPFCRRWKVTELALFGSALGADFRLDSDIDLLISFRDDSRWSLFDLVQMRDELVQIFGRPVDLVEKDGLRNPFRRRAILSNARVLNKTT